MVRCRFRALYTGLSLFQRTDAWFKASVSLAAFVQGAFGSYGSPYPDAASGPAVYRGSSSGDPWLSSGAAGAAGGFLSGFNSIQADFFSGFCSGGWVPPTAENTYTDVVGSVIRETLLVAEDDEGIPFVPATVESVPRETVNGMVRTLHAFRAAYRRALVTLSCRDHRMIADV